MHAEPNGGLVARELTGLMIASSTTRVELADMFGVSLLEVAQWEAGEPVPAKFISRLADTFGVSLPWLLYGAQGPVSVRDDLLALLDQAIANNAEMRRLNAEMRAKWDKGGA
jgi:transcriptional regulator with XRE-family HTH domain